MDRKRVPELMDDPSLDYESHGLALRGLARLNRVSNSAESLWGEIKKLYQPERNLSLRLLDIATGGGDVAIALDLKARKQKFNLAVTGADISADAVKYAQENAARQGAQARFIVMDALKGELSRQFDNFDVIITSLFTHHLDPPEVITLLSKMGQAARLVLVSDLVRSKTSYTLVWLATRILSSSAVVQYDGPVSVNAAFTASELLQMGQQAGLTHCQVKSCPPCRQLLIWKPEWQE